MDKRTDHVKREKVKGRGLVDSVFSWSIQDVLSKDLYKDQVEKIPDSFMSTAQYMKAFTPPLLVETHADLLSSTESPAGAPTCRILRVRKSKGYKPPKDLFYEISVEQTRGGYVPWVGDLIALTKMKLKCSDDLRKTQQSYLVAFVHAVNREDCLTSSILSSKPLVDEEDLKKGTLFAVNLINLTTNLRIWRSLNLELEGRNLNVIKKVLQKNFNDGGNCTICYRGKNSDAASACSRDLLQSFNLNSSQEAAVLSCIDTARCCHQYTVKLVQGPPGTGKTKTLSCLLHSLLRMKCRTLTCAPTNIAVLEVAGRVVRTVADVGGYETYGMGDIIVFGNRERMKIDGSDHNDLLHVFLDHRVDELEKCFDPSTGWKHTLHSLISLLEDPEEQYRLYLQDNIGKENLLTCERFVWERFNLSGKQLEFCIVNLYTHLPTTLISLEVMRIMTRALDLIRSLENLMLSLRAAKEGLEQILVENVDEKRKLYNPIKLRNEKNECLNTLRSLSQKFQVPNFADKYAIEKFCLSNACLYFCTVSTSAKLHTIRIAPLHCLVIDEAAQLKECESTIPLQLSGLHHAILIGDEQQLPATVNSQISEEAGFGRSLFERLVKLGCKSHLLNIQYRMHPSISLFPNTEFYGRQVLDRPNVKETGYSRRFLQGDMFGSYSFINIAHGKEEFDEQQSLKNSVEAAAIADIVGRLFKEINCTGKKVSIGIISPYQAQVRAIQERIGKFISDSDSAFSASVGTVDGFQGGEEDLIIISTVRSNERGSVGFVSNPQRANVVLSFIALTRARYCLWILGNEATLLRSGSIWKKIVNDAKDRQCFYNAEEDESLAQAITASMIEHSRLDGLLQTDSPLFRNARWTVCFSDDFRRSMARVKSVRICNEVLSVLGKLSNGWRQRQYRRRRRVMVHNGISSLLLEQYNICRLLNMIWTVDILLENSSYVQVLMVWDILPSSDIPNLATSLDAVFRNYTEEKMNRCLFRCMEGNLVVPVRWTADSHSAHQGSSSEASAGKLLKSPSLEDELSATAKAARNLVVPVRWTRDSRSARQGSNSEASAGKLLKSPCPEDELSVTAKAARNLVVPVRWTTDSRRACQGSSSEASAGKLLKSPCPEDELSATAKAARNLVVPVRWIRDSHSARQGSISEASAGKLLKSPCPEDERSATAKAARNLVVPVRWTRDSRSARQGSSSEASAGKLLKSPCPEDELSATAKAARNLVVPVRWIRDSRRARQGSNSEASAGKLLKSPCPEDELSATAKAARNLVVPMRRTTDSHSARQGSSSETSAEKLLKSPCPEDELSVTAKAARNLVVPMRWTADSRSARQGSSSEASAEKLLKSPCPEDEPSATAKAAKYATALAGATLDFISALNGFGRKLLKIED